MSQYTDSKLSTCSSGAPEASTASQAPPPYSDSSAPRTLTTELIEIAKRRGVTPCFAPGLALIKNPDKYQMLFDDSQSMRNFMKIAPTDEEYVRREDVMAAMVEDVFDLLSDVRGENDPISCRFMNRYPKTDIPISRFTDFQEMPNIFKHSDGSTPMVPRLKEMMTEDVALSECGLKTIVFTDGIPDGPCGPTIPEIGFQYLRNFLEDYQGKYHAKSKVTIALVTHDEKLIEDYGKVIDGIEGIDVMSVYPREKPEILKKQGPKFPFRKSDYLVKFVVGADHPVWDAMDERPLTVEELQRINKLNEEEYHYDSVPYEPYNPDTKTYTGGYALSAASHQRTGSQYNQDSHATASWSTRSNTQGGKEKKPSRLSKLFGRRKQ